MPNWTNFAIRRPLMVIRLSLAITGIILALVASPSLFQSMDGYLNPIQVDADPENMLDPSDPVRLDNQRLREQFSLSDIIVVGAINRVHPEGVFNRQSLQNIHDLVNYAKTIQWQHDDGRMEGVKAADIISLSTVDNVEHGGPGIVKFEWLMSKPPITDEEALLIKHKTEKLPWLNGTVLSDDGKSLALYIPITSKSISYEVTQLLRDRTNSYAGHDEFFVTGLPVAQDTFGVEMFEQMAVTAPAAMLLIFVLLYVFFRNVRLILAPLLVAIVSVVVTMGMLVVLGFKIHIMSSMIPIFIMPIAVLDGTHILSEFYDQLPRFDSSRKALRQVMSDLRAPMLYTTITTSIGFLSLNLTPLPPLQVFGTFVGIGVILAWVLTITIIPAYIVLMPVRSLQRIRLQSQSIHSSNIPSLKHFLNYLGGRSGHFAKPVLGLVVVLFVFAGYGITKIVVNDNPVKWFESSHDLRKSDHLLNKMFGGTYMAYLYFKSNQQPPDYEEALVDIREKLTHTQLAPLADLMDSLDTWSSQVSTRSELISILEESLLTKALVTPDDQLEDWDQALRIVNGLTVEHQAFKSPEVLRYLGDLQEFLEESGYIGKSNSIVDVVKTVRRELYGGGAKMYGIPDSQSEVAQTLFAFESSHRPEDLWHYITPDFQEASIWLQLKSGDNTDMKMVENMVENYLHKNPPPCELESAWFGLNHINVVWQDKIVVGMLKALFSSFVVVLVIMSLLFRSILWGCLAMVPLLFSVAVLYGFVGLAQIEYNAPIAILSSLILGLAVDYSIHFLTRSRHIYRDQKNWKDTVKRIFGEPARAISRNAIIIGVGFLPLLISNLVPYQTTGIFISSILGFAGVATLLILPALVQLLESKLFKNQA